ncbi:hypothetical protein [Tomitella gaofuii]|uniref:hypothetical protein n=1 Tax=Tomitella gaofuii TaxID=2760083 RepID=UPI0015FE2587|nr:hypothetical protein [Tomitella gaofuii]
MHPQEDALGLLTEVQRSRRFARRSRPRLWIPVALLGIVVAAASPLYRRLPMSEWGEHDRSGVLLGFGGLQYPAAAAGYWLVALPIAYALIAVYLMSWNRVRGVRINAAGAAILGLALYGLYFVLTVFLPDFLQANAPGDLLVRGLTPLILIALVILAWGLILRRWSMVGVGAVSLSASLVSNLYDVANPLVASGVDIALENRLMVNVGLTAIVLLIGALLLALTERR